MSRVDYPKQFLAFGGMPSLLEQTVNRLQEFCPQEQIWIVAREADGTEVSRRVPHFFRSNRVVLEPEGRDTSACVALSAMYIEKYCPNYDPVIVMMPADHLILQQDRFLLTLEYATDIASRHDGLVTVGIKPTRPETSYGYLEVGELVEAGSSLSTHQIKTFTEKPSLERAIGYLTNGGYLWNSGIFLWRVSVIQSVLASLMPDLVRRLEPLRNVLGDSVLERNLLREIYPTLPKVSIDYGVMEQATNALVVPADFGWDDLGTWTSLARVLPQNEQGNVMSGQVVAVDTNESILVETSGKRLIATFGLSNVVVVDTDDVVFVSDKASVSDMKRLTSRLTEGSLQRYLRRG